MSEFKFGDFVSYEEHGLGVVANGNVYFEDGDIYHLSTIERYLTLVLRVQLPVINKD